MKKIIGYLIFITFLSLISLIIILSTLGVETDKFNKFISDKASQTKNIKLKLNKVKYKIDIIELSLYLETQNPKINFKKVNIPVQNIKVYVDFSSILKSEPKIKKTNIFLKELDISQLNKLSYLIKPSNFKSLINNKIREGKIISEIEIFFTDQGLLKDFIAKGEVKNLKAELISNFFISK